MYELKVHGLGDRCMQVELTASVNWRLLLLCVVRFAIDELTQLINYLVKFSIWKNFVLRIDWDAI